jgi:hypothetical protein
MSSPILSESAEHLSEDLLEEYIFGRVSEPGLERLEEHLFVCIACRNKLEEVDACVALIKYGTAAWERDTRERDTWERDRERMRTNLVAWPGVPLGRGALLGTALATGIVCLALLGTRAFPPTKPAAPAAVKLVAMRGGESGSLTTAPGGRPLDLTLDRNTLPPETGYRLEMVNEAGREIWSGIPALAGATLSARITENPRPGVYWIRLYSSGGELLREFGMRVE